MTTASDRGLERQRIASKLRRFDAGLTSHLQPVNGGIGNEQLDGQRARDPQMVGAPPAHTQ